MVLLRPTLKDVFERVELSWSLQNAQVQDSVIEHHLGKAPPLMDMMESLSTYEFNILDNGLGLSENDDPQQKNEIVSLERTRADIPHRDFIFKNVPGLRVIVKQRYTISPSASVHTNRHYAKHGRETRFKVSAKRVRDEKIGRALAPSSSAYEEEELLQMQRRQLPVPPNFDKPPKREDWVSGGRAQGPENMKAPHQFEARQISGRAAALETASMNSTTQDDVSPQAQMRNQALYSAPLPMSQRQVARADLHYMPMDSPPMMGCQMLPPRSLQPRYPASEGVKASEKSSPPLEKTAEETLVDDLLNKFTTLYQV